MITFPRKLQRTICSSYRNLVCDIRCFKVQLAKRYFASGSILHYNDRFPEAANNGVVDPEKIIFKSK